ncbi:hypothetical protein CDL12_06186 [Handroanthus impetiginosus]|uniref:Uncharacterized protein n=1 Tax=Handroanthus impetiginosus TaxID=429701 RepID=A0A2G9HUB8_9LAMI|nr:hypothetical protein CDL12_06186 [Handroanthus impetiginosus]
MALLFNLTSLPSLSQSPSSTYAVTTAPCKCKLFRLSNNSIALQPKLYVGTRVRAPFVLNKRGAILVEASSADVDGKSEMPTPPSDGAEENVLVENLPLESKLQLKLEQKMRTKMAKKIRLRRKRLVRKCHLRKKGRWPPSKLKKNKNV